MSGRHSCEEKPVYRHRRACVFGGAVVKSQCGAVILGAWGQGDQSGSDVVSSFYFDAADQ